MTPRLIWRESASDDLLELYNWIAARSDVDTAFSYTQKVEAFANRLVLFPRRGTPRDEVAGGLRSIVYTGRTIVFYTNAAEDVVEIVRISHRGRDLGTMFSKHD